MKHRLSQVYGQDDYEEKIMDNILTLEMQDNGLAKIKISAFNKTPPEKVLHPKLGVGTQPIYSNGQFIYGKHIELCYNHNKC